MDKSLVVIIIYPLLTLSSGASWGYRDLTLADHECFFLILKFIAKTCNVFSIISGGKSACSCILAASGRGGEFT